MKHQIKSIPCLRVTAIGYDPMKCKEAPSTKICHKAKVAAEHYATIRVYRWWNLTATTRHSRNYVSYKEKLDKLERRALKVFQKYLP